ncbi:tumor protein p63-regulated gene 1 protein [Acipenser oxyrinchus oxyrinchus]|uniref:Tumor protein p63-regulated gene 1 protein n=1 Tax=Acipenser oxyrinchus oxyrinchus TaxID=40147 RepID=A0AAD8D573_ACIOX|nr:tumor protein p63-regulated gene 1 protein [Acipenser oxyrinchus oxyrinchus]
MSVGEQGDFKFVELGEEAVEQQSTKPRERLEEPVEPTGPAETGSDTQPEKPSDKNPLTTPHTVHVKREPIDKHKLKRFFVLRPGAIEQAIEEIQSMMDEKEDGSVQSAWLLAEVDHWNNEKERIVLLAENSLLICKYDFIMLSCEHIQRIPLNCIDRICHGEFTFPQKSLDKREGEGLRILWDRQREPTFVSRWNPFSGDFPFCTFTEHPVLEASDKFTKMCALDQFRDQLTQAAQRAHEKKPVPGKANGVLVLKQPILIETYVGLMSFIGNQNKLGYCLARGNMGF